MKMKNLLLGLLMIALSSCTRIVYTQFGGQQQNWPVATGAPVQKQFSLPVYAGPPNRPYDILGWVQVESGWRGSWPKYHNFQRPIKEAQKGGADAVITLANPTSESKESLLRAKKRPTRAIAIQFR